jgi:hypothetical protein
VVKLWICCTAFRFVVDKSKAIYSTVSICCGFVVQLFDLLWICCRVHNKSTTSWHVEMLWICQKVVDLSKSCEFVVDLSRCCGLVVDLPKSCGFVVELLYNLLYSKSTTNRTSGVWALMAMVVCRTHARVMPLSGVSYYILCTVSWVSAWCPELTLAPWYNSTRHRHVTCLPHHATHLQ